MSKPELQKGVIAFLMAMKDCGYTASDLREAFAPYADALLRPSPAAAAGVPPITLDMVSAAEAVLPESVRELVTVQDLTVALRAALIRMGSPVAPVGASTEEKWTFQAWALDKGYDIAHTYDTERSRWVWLNPMTADLWTAWTARALLSRQGCELATDATVQELPPGELTEEQWRLAVAEARPDELRAAAKALVDRWDTPLWKNVPHTGEFIARLRRALAPSPATAPAPTSP